MTTGSGAEGEVVDIACSYRSSFIKLRQGVERRVGQGLGQGGERPGTG